ncbi:hypothetical protein CHUAL_012213, partial [Chamberlinius hualienensis]
SSIVLLSWKHWRGTVAATLLLDWTELHKAANGVYTATQLLFNLSRFLSLGRICFHSEVLNAPHVQVQLQLRDVMNVRTVKLQTLLSLYLTEYLYQ